MELMSKVNMTRNWKSLIEEAKERIDGMKPWDAFATYMAKVGGIMDASDEAFASVVEAGSFRLDMRYGELLWEFFMPKTSSAATSCRKEITFLWEEFVPGEMISYTKEISIPYRDVGIAGFISVIKAEMNETMARKLAMDLAEADEKARISDLDSIKIQVRDILESGRFENKFETYLHIDTGLPYDFYRIVEEIRTALEYALCDFSDDVRRFLSCGRFIYDCSLEGDNLSFEYDADHYDAETEDFGNRVKFVLTVISSHSEDEYRAESITIQLDSVIRVE